jgi:hypothetical protein
LKAFGIGKVLSVFLGKRKKRWQLLYACGCTFDWPNKGKGKSPRKCPEHKRELQGGFYGY